MSALVLVGYAIRYGSTQEVDEAVTATLHEKGLKVDIHSKAGDREKTMGDLGHPDCPEALPVRRGVSKEEANRIGGISR